MTLPVYLQILQQLRTPSDLTATAREHAPVYCRPDRYRRIIGFRRTATAKDSA
jgi:hypothetical protein